MSYITNLASSFWRLVWRPFETKTDSSIESATPVRQSQPDVRPPHITVQQQLDLISFKSMSPTTRIDNWKLETPQNLDHLILVPSIEPHSPLPPTPSSKRRTPRLKLNKPLDRLSNMSLQSITTPVNFKRKLYLPTPDSNDYKKTKRVKTQSTKEASKRMQQAYEFEKEAVGGRVERDDDDYVDALDDDDAHSVASSSSDHEMMDIDLTPYTSRHTSPKTHNKSPAEAILDDTQDADDSTYTLPPSRITYTPKTLSAFSAEKARRLAFLSTLTSSTFTRADLTLYRHLELRGLEPLLPTEWKMYFPTLPPELFSTATFIHPLTRETSWQGARATEDLLKLGQKVRFTGEYSAGVFRWMKTLPSKFADWTLKDAGVTGKGWPSVLAVVGEPAPTMPEVLLAKTVAACEALDREWKGTLLGTGRECPPIYAVCHVGRSMNFSTYVPMERVSVGVEDGEGARLKSVCFLRWEDASYDVWNAFAIAILMVHCRNVLVEAVNGLENGEQMECVRDEGDEMVEDDL
jgi:hypothetical protein